MSKTFTIRILPERAESDMRSMWRYVEDLCKSTPPDDYVALRVKDLDIILDRIANLEANERRDT